MTEDKQKSTPARGWSAWRWAEAAAWAALGVQALSTLVSAFTSNPGFKVAAIATGGGFLVLRGIILAGVRERARWSLWCGSALALLFVAATPVLLVAQVTTSVGVIEVTPGAAFVGWCIILVNVAFFIACVKLLMSRSA